LEAQRVWPVACFLSLQLQNGVYMTTKITSIDAEIKRRKAALESDPRRQLRILWTLRRIDSSQAFGRAALGAPVRDVSVWHRSRSAPRRGRITQRRL